MTDTRVRKADWVARMEHEHKQENGNDPLGEIAEAEAWLDGFSTPGPSRIGVERTKQAMREELAHSGHNANRGISRAWWGGRAVAVAAAAVVVLAMTATWLSSRDDRISVADAGGEQAVEPGLIQDFGILESWSTGRAETMVAFSDEMSDLETWSSDSAGDWDAAIVFDASQDDATEGNGDDNENGDRDMSRLWPLFEQPSEEA